jgi:hypothetical protein
MGARIVDGKLEYTDPADLKNTISSEGNAQVESLRILINTPPQSSALAQFVYSGTRWKLINL